MDLLEENERSANKAAAKVMRVTVLIFFVALILDILGIFTVKLGVMIASFAIGTAFLITPTVIVNLAKAEGRWVKYVITTCAALFIFVISTTLSFHAVLVYIYPIAIASLYFSNKLNTAAVLITTLSITAGQLLGYKFDFVTDHNLTSVKKLVLFGIVPRVLELICISAIFTMLSKRTVSLLKNLLSAEEQKKMREKSLEMSEKLSDTVGQLESIASASAEANRSISEESSNVMKDSDDNFEHIKSVKSSMGEISENLSILSEMSGRIGELTRHSDEITANNDEKIALASESMEQIRSSSEHSRQMISQLSKQSKQIVEIADVISDISMQTNILAINASIEASHAGSAGAGFATVASEIKVLSDKTKKSASEISDLIEQITQSVEGTVSAIEQSMSMTERGIDSVQQMKDSAERISISNHEISENISKMNEVIDSVAHNGENVSAKISDLSRNIENNCGAVQHVAAAIEENSAGTASLNDMVKDIRVMADELKILTK